MNYCLLRVSSGTKLGADADYAGTYSPELLISSVFFRSGGRARQRSVSIAFRGVKE